MRSKTITHHSKASCKHLQSNTTLQVQYYSESADIKLDLTRELSIATMLKEQKLLEMHLRKMIGLLPQYTLEILMK